MNKALDLMNVDFNVDDLPWEAARVLYDWWLTKVDELGRPPSRDDFKPQQFVKHLPTIMLVDILQDPERFIIRLAGTKLIDNMGHELTGKFITELKEGDGIQARFSKQVENGKPYFFVDTPLAWANKEYSTYGILSVPLSDQDGNINMLLSSLLFKS